VHCKKLSMVKEGPYAGSFVEGPEYESLYALGSNCAIGSPEFVIAGNQLCNELGIDTMSTGVSLSFAMECRERGILSKKDTNNLDLVFSNDRAAFAMIEDIGFRRGFGDLLAEGTRVASQRIGRGTDFFAMHVKGMEMGGYDPRGAKGQSIVYAAGSRGGCHHSIGMVALTEMYKGIGRQLEGKAAMVLDTARRRILQDSLMNCTSAFWLTFDRKLWAEILQGITGALFTGDDLYPIADRINSLERLFNFREGCKPEDDTLPGRLMEEPLPDGPHQGERVSPEDLHRLLTEYYTLLGWSPDHGLPPMKA
jgi:aldehyde:ferredoxin oxidoreductase